MKFPQHILTIDFESYWSSDYTLSKLSGEAYVRDPQFLSFGAAVKYDDEPSIWVDGPELQAFFDGVPWDDIAVLAHHAHFDGHVLMHHYGKKPALWLDTLSMSRLLLSREKSHSLKNLSIRFGLPPKGDEVNLTKGLRVLPPLIKEQLVEYATHGTIGHGGDADLTKAIFDLMIPFVPEHELVVIDKTIRMFTEPKLVLNKKLARSQLAKVLRSKRSVMQRLGVTKKDLSSAERFSKLLEERFGIIVEMKEGKPKADGTPRYIPALASTDPFFKHLEEYEDAENPQRGIDVQALVAIRKKVKSTLEETRLRRLIDTNERGPLTIYLNYAKAHTQRWSGGDKMNYQNLTRGSELRKTIEAPDGYVLLVVDKAQIEARILNALAGQWDVVDLFAHGDPYSVRATKMFGRPIDRKANPEDKPEGQIGKVCELGLGYQMGPPKLQRTLRLGAMGAKPLRIDDETSVRWVKSYRDDHALVVDYWGQAERAIAALAEGVEAQPWGPFVIDKGLLWLPDRGVRLDYSGLYRDYDHGEWRMLDRDGNPAINTYGEPVRLYGGLMTENVVQWASRTDMAEDLADMEADGALDRWPIVMSTHDEFVFLVPEAEAQEAHDYAVGMMSRTKKWLPGAKLAAEGGFAKEYSK